MIYLASDHRGYELKEKIKQWLKEWNLEFEDMGAQVLDVDDDYPDYIAQAAQALSDNPDQRAIVLGYSGQAEAMVANKFKGVRCALYYGQPQNDAKDQNKPTNMLELTREDNNSNALSIGAGFIDEAHAKDIIKTWLDASFSGAERHQRRIDKIKQIEAQL